MLFELRLNNCSCHRMRMPLTSSVFRLVMQKWLSEKRGVSVTEPTASASVTPAVSGAFVSNDPTAVTSFAPVVGTGATQGVSASSVASAVPSVPSVVSASGQGISSLQRAFTGLATGSGSVVQAVLQEDTPVPSTQAPPLTRTQSISYPHSSLTRPTNTLVPGSGLYHCIATCIRGRVSRRIFLITCIVCIVVWLIDTVIRGILIVR